MSDLTLAQLKRAYDAALEQIAAESFLEFGLLSRDFVERLRAGNNPGADPNAGDLPGKLRMTVEQAQSFAIRYDIIDAYQNDATGFSAVALRDTATPGRVVLAVRSTELLNDQDRDVGADFQVFTSGFAFDQILSAEDFLNRVRPQLQSGETIDLVGYSLSGNIVRTLAAMYPDVVNQTPGSNVVFNATGLGEFHDPSGGNRPRSVVLQEMMSLYRQVEADPNSAMEVPIQLSLLQLAAINALPIDRADPNGNIYSAPRQDFAQAYIQNRYGTSYNDFGATVAEPSFAQYFGVALSGFDATAVANSGSHPVSVGLPIEGQPVVEIPGLAPRFDYLNTHSLALIADSLRLQVLFKEIDGSITIDAIQAIFQASSASAANTLLGRAEKDSLENALDAIRRVLLPVDQNFQPTPSSDVAGSFGNMANRTVFHNNITAIENVLPPQPSLYRIEALVNQPLEEVKGNALLDDEAGKGLAYRYALTALNPFVIIGPTYSQHNTNGELALFNSVSGLGAITTDYIQDRSLFLAAKVALNQANIDGPLNPFARTHYHDNTTGYDIPSGLSIPPAVQREYIFGSDSAETIAGGPLFTNDHLYGADGVDTLLGHGGNDYLQGDAGNDTLDGGSGADRMHGGHGNDTYIVDNLGDQVIEVGDNGRDRVESSVTFSLVGTTVEDLILTGSGDLNGTGNDLDNFLTGNSGMNRLEGRDGTDHLIGNDGDDVLTGGTGDGDLLEGGSGFDTYFYNAGDGLDRIEDSDAQGQIIFNGHRLLGGIHHSNDSLNTYTSLDGLTTYALSGTDLLVNGVLTVNENFQSGQFGIELRDVPDPNWENDYLVLIDFEANGLVNDIVNYSDADSFGFGERGNDQLFGNGGNDTLSGFSGNDRLYGGTGDDALDGDWRFILFDPSDPPVDLGTDLYYGDDWVEGGDGNDTIYGSWGDDVLYGGADNDLLYGDHFLEDRFTFAADDFLDGGEGDDELHGMAGDDVLVGGDGNDTLLGQEDDDWMDGGGGADVLWAGSGMDSLSGGSGVDILLGDLGNDRLDGGNEADSLYGGDGADELFGGAGNDLLFGDGLNTPEAAGVAGGNDFLDGGDGDDEVQGMIGDDSLFGGAGNDVLLGQEGDDTVFGDAGNDQVVGGAGADLLYGDADDDVLNGGTGNDSLFGGDDNDGIAGEEGNDALYGDAGNDTLQGDQGNDALVGGAGNDIYNFSLGDGQDTITDAAVGAEGNVINFVAGITPDALTFVHDPAQQMLTIQVGGGADSIRLLGFDPNTFQYVVETLRFADGSFVALADQLPLPGGVVEGTDEANIIRTGSGDDTVFAGAGNDVVYAGAGNDLLVGGDGADTLQGGAGQDQYLFDIGDGADTIVDTAGEGNRLVFGAGLMSSVLTLERGTGNTLEIRGPLSGDRLQIGALVPGASPISTFEFADGTVLTFEQFIARGIDLRGTPDADVITGTSFVDRIAGEAGNDILQGEAGNDVLDGGAGDDQLYGGEGADQLFGGAGDDVVVTAADDTVRDGGAGIDTISFQGVFGVTFDLGMSNFENAMGTDGDDTLTAASAVGSVQLVGNGGNDILTGGFGDDVLMGGEVFVGEGAADTLTGGAGNDRLEGGTGDDAYRFNLGDGQDRIVDSAVREDPFGGGEGGGGGTILEHNRLVFGEEINSQALQLSFGPGAIPVIDGIPLGSLRLSVGAGDSLVLSDFDAADLFSRYTIESFEFADTASMTYAQLVEERGFDVIGTDESDIVTGTAVADRINGFDGQDVLRSGLGADQLNGGVGDDQLFGGSGNDTYVFGVGTGRDVAFDPTGFDTIRMGEAIAPTDVRGAREGNDLVLSLSSTGDSLTLQNFYLHAIFQVEQVTFADGTIWDHARLLASTRRQIDGSAGDDVLTGGATDDTIAGSAGHDALIGQAGDDVLDGGTGADVMTGGDGADTYVVDDVGDVVIESVGEGMDTVYGGITYALTANVENLILTGTAAIDGTGNELDNMLTGNAGSNVLTGSAGNDTYVIGAGDLVVEEAGEGVDTVVTDQSYVLDANVENLTLTGTSARNGTGNELDNVLTGNAGVNVLIGGAGDDTYVIEAGDLVVEAAGEGTDTVVTAQDYVLGDAIENLRLTGNRSVNGVGNELDNRLVGNAAANILQGGLGNDTYVVGSDDLVVEAADAGDDTIEAAESYALGAHIENLTLLDPFPTLRVGLTPGTGESAPAGPESHYSGIGNELNNVLTGNRGDNVLEGFGGNDVLNGRGGNDTLKGGEGTDTYLFGVGDGQDRIEDHSVSGETDSVQLAPGLAPNQIGVVQSGSDLVLRMPGSMDSLTLADFFGPPSAAQKNVRFQDGTVWDEAILRALGADPGQGLTIVDADSGDNVLLGSSGHDVLTGGSGNDTLTGGGGNDILKDLAGNNVYDGGSGDDSLIGGAGNDGFMFGRGYGRDMVLVDQLFNDAFTTDTDHVQMVGLNPSDVIIQRQSSASGQLSFVITVLDTADQLTVRFRNGIYGFAPAPVTLNFADGTSQELGLFTDFPAAPSRTVFSSVDYALGGDEDNLVLVDSHSPVVPDSRVGIGNGLDNVMLGNTADNVLEGGAGHDVLHGGFARSVEGVFFVDTGSDILIGGEGNDTLIPCGDSAFAFDIGVGTDPNPFNTPDDVLIGGPGNDTYYIRHAGQTLVELPEEGVDAVHSTVSYSLPDNVENLVLTPTWSEDVGFISLTGTGNELDNVLVGGAGADLLSGGAGHDTLYGGRDATFDDGTPIGLPSSDTLVGGAGNDTYLFNFGDGIDTVEDVAAVGEGNRIQFGTGITPNDLTFTRDDVAGMLTIKVGASGTDQLVLTNFDPTGVNGSLVIENVVFADGSTVSLSSLLGGSINHAPSVVTSLADQSITQGSLFSFVVPTNTFADQDAVYGDTITYGATQADGTALPTWLTFNPSTRTFSGTPQGPDIGTVDVQVTATDTGALSAGDVFALTILPITGTEGNDTLIGTGGVDVIQGLAGDDVLQGLAGNDLLDGGPGIDSMTGGLGHDTYVVDVAGEVVTEALNQGTDTVHSSVTYTLGAHVENLVLTGTGAINGTGNSLNNSLTGNSANNQLNGRAGADTMTGGPGDDMYVVANIGDVVIELANEGIDLVQSAITYTLGADVEHLTLTGSIAIDGTGNILDNIIKGNSAANILSGGAGNDTYVVGTGDTVVELANEGIDTVQTAVTWTLGADVENLTLTGTGAISGGGNSLDNILTGNRGANTLDGGGGADSLIGGLGNDMYVVDNAGDVVIENVNEGVDTVRSAMTYVLGTDVENLMLIGSTAVSGIGNSLNNMLTGNGVANTLTGLDGNDTLDGGGGNDTLVGGPGNDTYVVDDVGDIVTENLNEGTDLVRSGVSYALAANVEHLTLTGISAIDGIGNTLNNKLTGNSAANQLAGGAGNDTYVVSTGDTVIEYANEGTDTVQSEVSWTLGANLEHLTLTGTAAINGEGNSLANTLRGNGAANVLTGGAGNDTYVVSTGDTVIEYAGEGTDTVRSNVSWMLDSNLEHLTLTGMAAINGEGNSLANTLRSNDAVNVLIGRAGNDTYVVSTGDTVIEYAGEGTDTVRSNVSWMLDSNLEHLTLTGTAAIDATGNMLNNRLTGNNAENQLVGGVGNDTLRGGLGNDTYLVNRGEGLDVIVENDSTAGNSDRLQYGAAINPLDLVISRQVDDLRLAVHGTADQVTIKDWYVGTDHQVETVQAGNGSLLLSTQVDQLIHAMAAFNQQTGLTWDQAIDQRPQDVHAILAANWQ